MLAPLCPKYPHPPPSHLNPHPVRPCGDSKINETTICDIRHCIILICSGITRAQWRALCIEITEVNLSTFVYRLFHEESLQSTGLGIESEFLQ